jgi:hypothetical protein
MQLAVLKHNISVFFGGKKMLTRVAILSTQLALIFQILDHEINLLKNNYENLEYHTFFF